MALIKCSECGKEISDKAVTCPNCGAPVSIRSNTAQPVNNLPKNNGNKSGFMKVCKYCKTSMPKEATICPNCKKKQTSNDWIVVLILIALIFGGLKSCGNNKNDKEPQQTNEEITVQTTEENKIEEQKEIETNSVQDVILDDEMSEFLSDE